MRRIVALLICALRLSSGGAERPDPCTPPNFPLPSFKAAVFNVREFGATGDGRTNDTAAINGAIEKCSGTGGGDVVFPQGTYLAASIHLRSNVRFVLDKNAVITGAKNGYDAPEPNEFERFQDFGHSHFHNALMWGDKIDNFAIVGGRINGGYIVKDEAKSRDIGDKVIVLKSSRNLLFDGVLHETGGHFVYLLNNCENVTLSNITIKKSRDAVNLVSCRNVQVHDCNFTGCGDDTLALKSDYALGRKIDSANIYVWNCYLETACNALQFGSETVGDFRNVNFWNIRIGRAWKAAIGIHSADGAVIDGVTYRNISIKGANVPVAIVLSHRLSSGEAGRKPGSIKNVTLSNITVSDCEPRRAGLAGANVITGLPGTRLGKILLEHVKFVLKGGGARDNLRNSGNETDDRSTRRAGILTTGGLFVKDVHELTLRDVEFDYDTAESRPAIVAKDMDRLELDELRAKRTAGTPALRLDKIDKLTVRHSAGLTERQDQAVDELRE